MSSDQSNFKNFHNKTQEIQKGKKNIVLSNAIEYCENTTIHGFSYWVSCESLPQKLFWVATVVAGLFCACLINSSAVQGWIDKPATTVIQTFSKVNISLNNERRIVSLKYLLPSFIKFNLTSISWVSHCTISTSDFCSYLSPYTM